MACTKRTSDVNPVPQRLRDNEVTREGSGLRYRVNDSNVVFDLIDGEVLAIRSDSGAYYSLRGTAATAWCALLSGCPCERLAGLVADHHGADPAVVAGELSRFAADLVAESLLLILEDARSQEEPPLPAETRGQPWAAPVFEVYTDMQDLLLFDPIHEVDNSGWPRVTPSAP